MIKTKEKGSKKQNKGRYILILLSVVIFFLLVTAFFYNRGLRAISVRDPVEIEIEIPAGSNSKQIASILKEEGLIRNEFVFKIQTKKNRADGNLKAGVYSMNTGMDVDNIIQYLSKGSRNRDVFRVTIPEGYEIRQIANKLADEGIIDKEEFLMLASNKEYFEEDYPFLKQLDKGQGLEGYLFPSTYELYPNAREEEIIGKMIAEFQKVYENDIKEKMSSLNLSLNELVTLASIVEREAKRDEERELVSAVFHNRLKDGMILQSCATVQYVLGERKENLSDRDTQIESPYNTYLYKGLPPAPIASPGRMSLIASIQPARVDYLYFRTKEDGTGGHTFSRTYEEHLDANPNK